ncbi:MAG: PilZ domain-containing protein [Myxococcota bacterium]
MRNEATRTASLAASLQRILADPDDFGTRFYGLLFDRYPKARFLFRSSGKVQRQHLAAALELIAGSRRCREQQTAFAQALVGVHLGHGVSREQLRDAGDILFAALAETLGDAWTPDLAEAWCEAYAPLQAEILRAAAQGARPPAPERRTGRRLELLDPLELAAEYLSLTRRARMSGVGLDPGEEERRQSLRRALDRLVRRGAWVESSSRRAIRVPVRIDAKLSRGNALITELGERGVFVATKQPVEPGTRVRLEILGFPDGGSLPLEGRCVWARASAGPHGKAGMGICFDELSVEQEARLLELVERSLVRIVPGAREGLPQGV